MMVRNAGSTYIQCLDPLGYVAEDVHGRAHFLLPQVPRSVRPCRHARVHACMQKAKQKLASHQPRAACAPPACAEAVSPWLAWLVWSPTSHQPTTPYPSHANAHGERTSAHTRGGRTERCSARRSGSEPRRARHGRLPPRVRVVGPGGGEASRTGAQQKPGGGARGGGGRRIGALLSIGGGGDRPRPVVSGPGRRRWVHACVAWRPCGWLSQVARRGAPRTCNPGNLV
jgi:hypothetical protein